MITLLIARHGNTFDAGDTVLRVGKKTDLDLSESGKLQANKLAELLSHEQVDIDQVFASTLKRTQQTAEIVKSKLNINSKIKIDSFFDEIDYGPDEGQPESKVLERIGSQALTNWELNEIPADGWLVAPEKLKRGWVDFSKNLEKSSANKTILIITSNGIARFAPSILNQNLLKKEARTHKMRTGSLSCFCFESAWTLKYWDKRL